MASRFHQLTIAEIVRQTPDAVSLALVLPDRLRDRFHFDPGQYLTLAARVEGEEIRRSYSICSMPGESCLRVGVKKIPGGRFSCFVNERLGPGDTIRVMSPQGRFTAPIGGRHDYLLIAAGSGITPILSIARTVLTHEPDSTITLLYGNRTSNSIMFHEELEDLKDSHLHRFKLVNLLSREHQDSAILNGRIDGGRIGELTGRGVIDPLGADGVYICGPGAMIDETMHTLTAMGVEPERLACERFVADGARPAQDIGVPALPRCPGAASAVECVLDGVHRSFSMGEADRSVLDAAQAAGIELPYSCAGGMCCTCRCRIVEGAAEMAVNYSLQPWEIAAGYTLACQSRPTTRRLVLDFDTV